MPVMGDTEFKRLQEIMADAEMSPHLSVWEENFLGDLRPRVAKYGVNTHISDKQWGVIDKIEKRIYA